MESFALEEEEWFRVLDACPRQCTIGVFKDEQDRKKLMLPLKGAPLCYWAAIHQFAQLNSF